MLHTCIYLRDFLYMSGDSVMSGSTSCLGDVSGATSFFGDVPSAT